MTRVDFRRHQRVATLDNKAGLNHTTISTLSTPGVNGAFTPASGNQIGSPGTIGAVPEASSLALMAAGLAAVAGITRRRPPR